jgi:flavodoxin
MHSLLILYGTETGNAQDVAERIGRDAIRHRSRARVIAMEEYSLVGLQRNHFSSSNY